MTLKIAGVWCRAKSDFDKYVRRENYDLVISHNDIFSRLLKSDPNDSEPSETIISLYISKLFKNIPVKFEGLEQVNVVFLFKNLDNQTVSNFRGFIEKIFDDSQIDLIIIDRCDYPKKGVLSQFDTVKFIDHD